MINKSTLLGRLARDPELREFSNGGKICRLKIITSRSWKDSDSGEFKEKVEGHNVAIYVERIAERIHEKCRKGDIVFVEGPMETRRWTDGEGKANFMTEVAIRPYLGGIRRLPSGRTAAAEQMTNDAGTERPSIQDTIPALGDDVFDDDFLDNGIGEFGSDLSDFGSDEGSGFPF